MKKIKLLLLLLLYSSCYKAVNTNQSNIAPTFTITAGNSYSYSGGNIADSVITFTINDSTILNIGLTFTLLSGNPENYPITAFISGLPKGIVVSQDSFV